jgi:hypothetical protein
MNKVKYRGRKKIAANRFSLPPLLGWHRGCLRRSMIDFSLVVLALVTGGFAVELYSAAVAKLGHRDKHGFDLGFEAYHHAED